MVFCSSLNNQYYKTGVSSLPSLGIIEPMNRMGVISYNMTVSDDCL